MSLLEEARCTYAYDVPSTVTREVPVRLTCHEFGRLVETLRGLRGQCILGAARTRDWRLRIDSNVDALMTDEQHAERTSDAINDDGSFHLLMLLSGRRLITLDGGPFNESNAMWVARGRPSDPANGETASWLSITASLDLVLDWADMQDDEPHHTLLARGSRSTASAPAASLLRLVHRLFSADTRSGGRRHEPAARSAAHEAVLDMLFAMALPIGRSARTARSHAHHVEVLDKALALMDASDTDLLCTEGLCVATGVSERTVRNVFQEYLGMSPHRYLMARRLQAIRSAIHRAGPHDTITSICARFGEWDFGRLAKRYKAQFGELPSESLYGFKRHGPNRVAADRLVYASAHPEALR